MSRIDLVTPPLPPEVADLAAYRDGQPLNFFRLLARNTALTKRVARLGGYLLGSKAVPQRAKEIVILRAAQRAGCQYEFNQHALLGVAAGLSTEEVEALARPSQPHAWSEADQALIRMVDELHAGVDVSDETWGQLAKSWSPEQLLELLVIAGLYRAFAGVMKATRLPLDGNVPHREIEL